MKQERSRRIKLIKVGAVWITTLLLWELTKNTQREEREYHSMDNRWQKTPGTQGQMNQRKDKEHKQSKSVWKKRKKKLLAWLEGTLWWMNKQKTLTILGLLLALTPMAVAVGKENPVWKKEWMLPIAVINVASILTEARRFKIFKYLKRRGIEIAILTETNLSTANLKEFNWMGWTAASETQHTNNRSGISIITKRPIKITNLIQPKQRSLQGRALAIDTLLVEEGRTAHIRIWGYYSPADREERFEFLKEWEEFLAEHYDKNMFNIIGGDTNIALHPQDRTVQYSNPRTLR
eukprot:TRINITY_DN8222_c0_g1_i9.p1 TRINITY_DN8222_c0_g1~~TRINITY_DN8222_c0_g1_i9.p1  ORF type:complete len:292 (+),score=47.21 TRINITY_DN8222_c0_g1_i9:246-1121(+)